MRVFVTGASGHIASAVIPELVSSGHQVVGLARSDASAEVVAALGAEVRRGDLDDLDGLKAAAAETDGVIHLAFKHEAMRTGDFMGAVGSDLAAIQAIGEALTGTGKPFVTTGGPPAHPTPLRPAGRPPDARHGRDYRPPRHRGRPVRRRSPRRCGQLHDR